MKWALIPDGNPSVNRTTVELKRCWSVGLAGLGGGVNRTTVELKHRILGDINVF